MFCCYLYTIVFSHVAALCRWVPPWSWRIFCHQRDREGVTRTPIFQCFLMLVTNLKVHPWKILKTAVGIVESTIVDRLDLLDENGWYRTLLRYTIEWNCYQINFSPLLVFIFFFLTVGLVSWCLYGITFLVFEPVCMFYNGPEVSVY